MATFILLHGSWHAAWNWHRLMPHLQAAGHKGIALDLPGHGLDTTPASRVSLSSCVDAVLEVVDAQDEPVILFAHSRNGIVISQAAERRPDKIKGLVYLAAYLVPDGRSMMDYALQDDVSLVAQNVETAVSNQTMPLLVKTLRREWVQKLAALLLPERLQSHRLRRSAYQQALYHDCGDEITELANVLLQPEPNWPGFTALRLSREHYGRVPRVYIECLQDRAVSLKLQRQMLAETPCDAVFTLDSSHSPFFSQPQALARLMHDSNILFETRAGRNNAQEPERSRLHNTAGWQHALQPEMSSC